jgi:hypothetical protein
MSSLATALGIDCWRSSQALPSNMYRSLLHWAVRLIQPPDTQICLLLQQPLLAFLLLPLLLLLLLLLLLASPTWAGNGRTSDWCRKLWASVCRWARMKGVKCGPAAQLIIRHLLAGTAHRAQLFMKMSMVFAISTQLQHISGAAVLPGLGLPGTSAPSAATNMQIISSKEEFLAASDN